MDLELNGKVALVAAASKGLGYGIAKALAENGAKVSLCSRTEADVQDAAQTLNNETGAETMATACDLSDAESIQAWVDKTVEKWGQNGLVKTLADELAPDGIRINNLIPGRIHTDRTDALDAGLAKRIGITQEEAKARSEQAIPMKRLGTTDEFGRMGAFLLSPAASYITGTSMRVDGGKTRAISS